MSNQKLTSENEIIVSGLTVKAGARNLLVDADAVFPNGQITILVGPSGVGKSILMRIIAGLLGTSGHEGIEYDGNVTVGGEKVVPGQVGVVFQSFALFDELSPKANVRFAKDHRQSRSNDKEEELYSVDGLFSQLKIPSDVPTSRLSGGQRQRLAIARALAFDPEAILYDEPTSGLDPATGRDVAELIQSTHEKFQKTTVVVTHDYATLLPIADRVVVLDPVGKKLTEIAKDKWLTLESDLKPMAKTVVTNQEQPLPADPILARSIKNALSGTTRCFEAVGIGALSILPTWKDFRWGTRYLVHFMRLVAGPTAWFYLIMAGIIVGFVTTHFTFQFLPFSNYTEPLLEDDLLLAIGFSLYRLFVPIIATVLIAARCGAAVTSDIGARQYGHQNDALLTFGVPPRSYLLTPIMISFLIGTPLLTLLAFFAARYTSLAAFVSSHPSHGPHFWDFHFHRKLRVLGQIAYIGTPWLMFKLISCGFGTGIIAYYQGMRTKHSTSDISRSVTSTILWATLYVLTVHFAFAFFEFNKIE